MHDWIQEFCGAVTVCDEKGIILEMNDKAARTFEKEGGTSLIGCSVLDCHPEPARTKLSELLRSQSSNIYTIEKNGIRKLVYQSPWYQGNRFAGLVEIILEIPAEMPYFVRK